MMQVGWEHVPLAKISGHPNACYHLAAESKASICSMALVDFRGRLRCMALLESALRPQRKPLGMAYRLNGQVNV